MTSFLAFSIFQSTTADNTHLIVRDKVRAIAVGCLHLCISFENTKSWIADCTQENHTLQDHDGTELECLGKLESMEKDYLTDACLST